ncbi:hypothetical protein nvc2_046 [Namao virus]|nr:hypothetical protein nvc2_046 [Namao virus]
MEYCSKITCIPSVSVGKKFVASCLLEKGDHTVAWFFKDKINSSLILSEYVAGTSVLSVIKENRQYIHTIDNSDRFYKICELSFLTEPDDNARVLQCCISGFYTRTMETVITIQ